MGAVVIGDTTENWRRAVIYFAWGSKYLNESVRSAESVQRFNLPTILVTDKATAGILSSSTTFDHVVAVDLENLSNYSRSNIWQYLPGDYNSFLFIDSDTIVLMDVLFGFDKAERYGIAICQAPHYSLDHFWHFDKVLDLVGVPKCNQLLYNGGVIFFTRCSEVQGVFEKWSSLCNEYGHLFETPMNQPFLTLAMELLEFNPYTLSPAYNSRGMGELVSGYIRIWHSHHPVPPNVNLFDKSWPPRRYLDGEPIPYSLNAEDSALKSPNLMESLRLAIKRLATLGNQSEKLKK